MFAKEKTKSEKNEYFIACISSRLRLSMERIYPYLDQGNESDVKIFPTNQIIQGEKEEGTRLYEISYASDTISCELWYLPY